MRMVLEGADRILDNLDFIQMALKSAYSDALTESLEFVKGKAIEKLQSIVYERSEGGYEGISRGPFAEPLKEDLFDKFLDFDIRENIGYLIHESLPGPMLEFGTPNHSVAPRDAPAMVYTDPDTGELIVRKDTYPIAGVRALHWYEQAFNESREEIIRIFNRHYSEALREAVR